MPRPLTSQKRARALSSAFLLLSLAVIAYLDAWWPGILLAIGLPLAFKQYLLGRSYDTVISLVLFGGAFASLQFDISWELFLPILFCLGAIYILFREFTDREEEGEAEREEDLNHELEEKKK